MNFNFWFNSYFHFFTENLSLVQFTAFKEKVREIYEAAQPQWQPISTVPENILEYELDILVIERKGLPCVASYDNLEREWFDSTTAALLNPTHWTFIPKREEH